MMWWMKGLVLLWICLATAGYAEEARAFVDPPTFSPAVPSAGQPIRMFLRRGQCHVFAATFPPGTPYQINVEQSIVEVILNGASIEDPILCNVPIGTGQWELGALPAGQYTVRIRIRDLFAPFVVLPTIAEASLTVRGLAPAPQQIPVDSQFGRISLILLIVGGAFWVARARRSAVLCALLMAGAVLPPEQAQAQERPQWLDVELARVHGAPSPADLVEGLDCSTATPPLSGLRVEHPQAAS